MAPSPKKSSSKKTSSGKGSDDERTQALSSTPLNKSSPSKTKRLKKSPKKSLSKKTSSGKESFDERTLKSSSSTPLKKELQPFNVKVNSPSSCNNSGGGTGSHLKKKASAKSNTGATVSEGTTQETQKSPTNLKKMASAKRNSVGRGGDHRTNKGSGKRSGSTGHTRKSAGHTRKSKATASGMKRKIAAGTKEEPQKSKEETDLSF